MQKLIVTGNLTVDPKMKEVNINGVATKVVNFSIALNERGREEPTYFRVHAWRGLAETCAKYLKKGRKVMVTGPVHQNSYKDSTGAIRYAMEVRADEIEFLDRNPDSGKEDALEQLDEADVVAEPVETPEPARTRTTRARQIAPAAPADGEEDLPF